MGAWLGEVSEIRLAMNAIVYLLLLFVPGDLDLSHIRTPLVQIPAQRTDLTYLTIKRQVTRVNSMCKERQPKIYNTSLTGLYWTQMVLLNVPCSMVLCLYFCKCVSVNIFKFQYRLKVPILNSDGYLFSHMPIQQIPAMLMGLIHTQVSQIISIQPLFFIFVHISKELSFFFITN